MMLVNDLQYQTTKERLEGFKRALAMLRAPDNELKKKKPFMWQLNIDALLSMIDDFTEQMRDYEELINRDESQPIVFEIDSIEELPRALIKARIASKISQQEMADKLGISEKQFQQYEDYEYEQAPLNQLLEVGHILAIKIQPKTTLAVAV